MEPVEYRQEHVAVGNQPPVAPGTPVAATSYPQSSVVAGRSAIVPVGWRASQIVWLIVGVVDAILALDFIFRAAGANDTGFASFIYNAGWALAAPFHGIFNSAVVNGRSYTDWADLLAIAIYTLAAWGVTKVVMIANTPRGSSARTV